MLTLPKHVRGLGSLGLAAVVLAGCSASEASSRCSELDRLALEADTGFDGILGDVIDRASGQWSTSFQIEDASFCSVTIDPERASYLCEWEHPIGGEAGKVAYEAEIERVRSCLAETNPNVDGPVNHPDFYASTTFTTPGSDVTVALKDKNALEKVYVSVRVDSSVTPGAG